jgi:hypothetical protein
MASILTIVDHGQKNVIIVFLMIDQMVDHFPNPHLTWTGWIVWTITSPAVNGGYS